MDSVHVNDFCRRKTPLLFTFDEWYLLFMWLLGVGNDLLAHYHFQKPALSSRVSWTWGPNERVHLNCAQITFSSHFHQGHHFFLNSWLKNWFCFCIALCIRPDQACPILIGAFVHMPCKQCYRIVHMCFLSTQFCTVSDFLWGFQSS